MIDLLDIDDKREWVNDYYENDPPDDCVYVDDADAIGEAVQRFVEDMDDEEIDQRYQKLKATKKGAYVFENWIHTSQYNRVSEWKNQKKIRREAIEEAVRKTLNTVMIALPEQIEKDTKEISEPLFKEFNCEEDVEEIPQFKGTLKQLDNLKLDDKK